MAPPGTVTAASSPLPTRIRGPGGGSRSRTRASRSNSPIRLHSRAAAPRPRCSPGRSLRCERRGAKAATTSPDRRSRRPVRDAAAQEQTGPAGDPARPRPGHLRLPRPHRRRPVVGDQGQGRPFPRPLADPGVHRPPDLLRAQRPRLGPDPPLPRLPDRGRPGPGRLGPAAPRPLRPGQRPLRPRQGAALRAGGCPAPDHDRERRLRTGDLGHLGDRDRLLLLHQPSGPPGHAAALCGAAAGPGGDRRPPPARLRPARQPRAEGVRPRTAAGGDLAAGDPRPVGLLRRDLGRDLGRRLLRRPLGQLGLRSTKSSPSARPRRSATSRRWRR